MEKDEDVSKLRKLLSFKNITLVERLLLGIMMLTVALIATVAFMFILRGS